MKTVLFTTLALTVIMKATKPRYLEISDPVYKTINIPRDEQMPKQCPVCDYAIAWNKQKAGIFINCCHCFHPHETMHTAIYSLIDKLKDLIGDDASTNYYPKDWKGLPINEMQSLKTSLINTIAELENDDEWELV